MRRSLAATLYLASRDYRVFGEVITFWLGQLVFPQSGQTRTRTLKGGGSSRLDRTKMSATLLRAHAPQASACANSATTAYIKLVQTRSHTYLSWYGCLRQAVGVPQFEPTVTIELTQFTSSQACKLRELPPLSECQRGRLAFFTTGLFKMSNLQDDKERCTPSEDFRRKSESR
jgi:hypothetical protein